jgi:hypothetical protein
MRADYWDHARCATTEKNFRPLQKIWRFAPVDLPGAAGSIALLPALMASPEAARPGHSRIADDA